MNLYLLKRDPEKVEYDEYAGFLVRAPFKDAALELVAENYNLDRVDSNEQVNDHYTYEFEITLIASGVVGEPSILLADFKAG